MEYGYNNRPARPVGFLWYKELLGDNYGRFLKLNMLTLAGMLPFGFGILFAVSASSVVVLIPACVLGGMIFGPFLSGLYDGLYRAFRYDPTPWWDAYVRSWKQNFLGSLIPGAILGLLLGMTIFAGLMMFWWAVISPSPATVLLYIFSFLLMLMISTLYWPQLVLFRQSAGIRLRNAMMFCIQYFWRMLGVCVLQAVYWLIYVLFAPWTLVVLPFIGIWYIVFLSQFFIYDQLDEALSIEDSFREAQ